MAVIISTSTEEKTFAGTDVINIGSNPNCDVKLNINFDLLISVQYNPDTQKCTIINNFQSPKVLFRGKPIKKIEISDVCKIMIADTDEFIGVRLVKEDFSHSKTVTSIAQEDFTEADIKGLYGNEVNASTKVKLEKQKEDIEAARVSIIKEVGFTISDLKSKLTSNGRTKIFLHIAMLFSAMVCAFGVSNYLMGLSIQESANYLHLPTNLKVWGIYTVLIYGICLLLKQGVYLYLQSNIQKDMNRSNKIAEVFMLTFALIFVLGIYVVNLVYYMNLNDFLTFAIFISFFFSGIMAVLAISCGYFKCNESEWNLELNKHEYREDFEGVIKAYRKWIDRYVNSLSNSKIQYIKDKMFNLQIKSGFEILVGILTAPFLAYGVSNTLAMCFPEAAGWVRISGLRISPVFLVLATFLIIFAFFTFVSAFTASKKIQGSQVIKQDGFSDYIQHGVTIYGLEGIRRLEFEKRRSFAIAISIILIEFSMNVSYFMTEIGGDLNGILLSIVAALVPTALLIAETVMMSQTRFEVTSCDELIAKLDKD
ncbi:MAG: hypothetical protein LKG27_03130 [Clostridiaceae bacterium]|jgi:hypothetical protein|nr:hypothetical protein [Clostridiaceae bacterium]